MLESHCIASVSHDYLVGIEGQLGMTYVLIYISLKRHAAVQYTKYKDFIKTKKTSFSLTFYHDER